MARITSGAITGQRSTVLIFDWRLRSTRAGETPIFFFGAFGMKFQDPAGFLVF
jgi:hypothetical protein